MTVTQRIGARIQSSNEVNFVLKETLELRFVDPRISLLNFPSSAWVDANLLLPIVERLQGLVVAANKLREQLVPALCGAVALSVSGSSSERISPPLVTRETVLIVALGFMLSLLPALRASIDVAFDRREQ